jgi:AcrR family transcriptional regulator
MGMPAIFNEQNREAVRQNMLENGFELLKKYGFKRMTVADIAKACGLAKGTFYTFFPSKEEFIYQIVLNRRNMVRQKYIDMAAEHGKLGREQFLEFLQFFQSKDINAYQYLTNKEMNYLAAKWPREHSFNPGADEKTTLWLMSHMKNLRKGANWKVLANFMKTLALIDMSKNLFHEDALDETIKMMQKGMMDYLFSEDRRK